MTRFALVLVPLVTLACTSVDNAVEIDRTSVNELLSTNARFTGLSIEPDTGALVLLQDDGGLWRVGDTIEQISGADRLQQEWSGQVQSVAAMGGGRYAVTVPSVGLLLDTDTGALDEFFCYEPGSFGDWSVMEQVTNTLAFDTESGNLFSQPTTIERTEQGTDYIRSDVAEFDGMEGGDLAWFPLDSKRFQSNGLAVRDGVVTLLENGVLYELEYTSGQPRKLANAEQLVGAEDMVWQGDDLVVLDGATQELVRIRF